MSKIQRGYTAEYKQQVVEQVRRGRSPAELAEEIEPSVGTIRRWVREASGGSKASGRKKARTARRSAKSEMTRAAKRKEAAPGELLESERAELEMLRREMAGMHADREELSRLREENRVLKEEREILRQDRSALKQAVAWLFRKVEKDLPEKGASVMAGTAARLQKVIPRRK